MKPGCVVPVDPPEDRTGGRRLGWRRPGPGGIRASRSPRSTRLRRCPSTRRCARPRGVVGAWRLGSSRCSRSRCTDHAQSIEATPAAWRERRRSSKASAGVFHPRISGAVRSGSRRRLRSLRRSSGTGRCPWGRLAQESVGVLVRSPLPRAVGVSATLEQHCRPPVHRELGLELPDPPSGCHQLGLVRRGQAGLEAPVDAILSPPRVVVWSLDTRMRSRPRRFAASLDQIEQATRNSGGYLPLVPVARLSSKHRHGRRFPAMGYRWSRWTARRRAPRPSSSLLARCRSSRGLGGPPLAVAHQNDLTLARGRPAPR